MTSVHINLLWIGRKKRLKKEAVTNKCYRQVQLNTYVHTARLYYKNTINIYNISDNNKKCTINYLYLSLQSLLLNSACDSGLQTPDTL